MQRDLGAMTTEEQRAAVMRDAPELAALLADLQSNLAEVRSRVGPLLTEVRASDIAQTSASSQGVPALPGLLALQTWDHLSKDHLSCICVPVWQAGKTNGADWYGSQEDWATAEGAFHLEAKYLLLLHYGMHLVFLLLLSSRCLVAMQVRKGELATAEGVSYLEAKYLLLLHYCMHLVFYILLKAEGRPVRDHPVIARLVEIRAFLEKARPIDKRLRYQMDKLLNAVATLKVALLCIMRIYLLLMSWVIERAWPSDKRLQRSAQCCDYSEGSLSRRVS